MGQFYRGTEATFIDDAMFKLPYELMGQVIDKKDKAIDDTIGQYQSYLDKLKADVLEQDSPELRATIQQYQTRIDSAIQGITSDPMNYQKYTPQLNTLGRDITNTWSSTGKVGSMEANKKKVLTEYDTLDKLAKEKGYSADYISAEKRKILEKYKGVEWDEERGKAMGAPEIADAYHKLDFDEGFLSHLKAQKISKTQDTPGGPWVYRKEGSTEKLNSNDIIGAYMLQANADPGTQAALQRYNQLGVAGYESVGLNEVYMKVPETDASGKAIIENGEPKMKEVLNPNNYWAKKMGAAAETYKVDNKDDKDTLSESGVYSREWSANRADAKEAKDNVTAETVDQTSIITRDSTAIDLGNNSRNANIKAITTINTALEMAVQLKIKPGTTAYNQIKNGNFTALRVAGKGQEGFSGTVDQLEKSYKRADAERGLAAASINAFTETLPADLQKIMYAPGSSATWYKNPKLQAAYKAYTDKAHAGGKFRDIAIENQITSLNDADIAKNTKESFKKVIIDDLDKFSFKLGGTQGEGQIMETASGVKLAFTNNKNLNGKPGTLNGESVTYVFNADGNHSLAELQKLGVVNSSVVTDGKGTKKKYVFYENGKEVGMDVAEDTFGIVKAYDTNGQANMGVHIQMGKNTIRATLGANQVTSPEVRDYFAKNDDNLYFQNQESKTNWKMFKKEIKHKDGNTYLMKYGKAYMNGVERTDAIGIKAIKKVVMGL
jgi:hypothetical protein